LGGSGDIPVKARIISATNQNLEALIKGGRFREDLYYRLNVFRIVLPPLRERKEDIPLLTEHLLEKLYRRMGRARPVLSGRALEKLVSYSYPGNVRELENILERALIYCEGNAINEGDIDLHRMPGKTAVVTEKSALSPESGENPLGLSMEAIEKKAILDCLARCQGNRTRAAEMLGLSRKTILNKLRSWGLYSLTI
jgi:two-component system response regulator AtoC